MVLDTSSVLEVLRDHIHAPEADFVELEALLAAAAGQPGDALICDYLVDQARDRLASGDVAGFLLAELALTHAPAHPRLPDAAVFVAAFEALGSPRPASALRLIARLVRQGGMALEVAVGMLGTFVRELSRTPLEVEVASVVECATTVLAVAYASDMVASVAMAEQLCAFLRGVELWNARRHALAMFGEAFAMDPALAHTVFVAFLDALSAGGAPYLMDRVRGRTIGMREVRFAPLSAFVQVVMPAAAVADLSRHGAQWTPGRVVRVVERLWVEAAGLLERCGVNIPVGAVDGDRLKLEPFALLTGPDGRLAVQCALAASESMLSIGERDASARLASLVRRTLMQLTGPTGYLEWAREVERRGCASVTPR